MADLEHILRRAARRSLVQRALQRAGCGLLAAAGAGIALLLADRLLALGAPGWFYGVVGLAGPLGGAISAVLTPPPRLAVARLLDRTFDLKDRLSSAEALGEARMRRQDASFAALVRRDADRLAGTLDVAAATPVRITGIWGGATSAVALLVLGVLFLPELGWAGQASSAVAQREQALQEQREAVAESIEETIAELDDGLGLDERSREDLKALEQLASQLTARNEGEAPPDPGAARDESAARLNELADRLAEEAEKDAAAADELARRFAGMETPDTPMSAEEFAEALKRGEFGEAANLLDDMMRSAEKLPESEREALAKHLRELSEQVQQAGGSPNNDDAERQAHLEQALRDQGMDQQDIDELLDQSETDVPTPEEIQQQLEQRDIDEQIARELAREIDEQRRREEVDEQAQRDSERIADSLDEAADAIEEPPGETPESQQAQEPQPPEATGAEPSEPPSPPDQQPGEPPVADQKPPEAADRSAQEQSQDPSSQKQQRRGQSDQTQPGSEGQPQQQGQQRATEEKQAGQERQTQEQPGQSQPDTRKPGEPKSGQRQQGEEQQREAQWPQGGEQGEQQPAAGTPDGQQPEPLVDPSTGEQRQLMPDDQAEEPGASPTPQPDPAAAPESGTPTPADVMRELERRRESAADRRQTAEEIRDAAQRMAENMTEEEKQRWAEQWKRQFGDGGAGQGGGDEPAIPPLRDDAPPITAEEFDDVDLAGDDDASRLLAEWLGEAGTGEAPSGVESRSAGERVRQARRAAERAVEDSTVPTRYHRSIKRYFDRLRETLEKASGETAGSSADERDP